jgi:ATP/maltotriose-dependent transcriptional regulator MalT
MIGRERELAVADDFLDGLADGAAAVVLEGEPGIGKTTLWVATIARAEQRGCRVLSCRAAEAEAKLSYAALADLLSPVDEEAFGGLPGPQRRAIDAALLRADTRGGRVDQRAVSAAVASLLIACARERPLVVAIDDVHWLDSSSARVLAYAVRRLDSAAAGVLVSLRSEGGASEPLELDRALPSARVRRLRLGPLSLGALRQILTARLGFAPSRPLLLRIERHSGGNPFFALELATALAVAGVSVLAESPPLPERLRHLFETHIEQLPTRTREALLSASALARPTLALIERAGQPRSALDRAEAAGVIAVRDGSVRFLHPLLASAVYGSVSPSRRRRLHRRLAGVVGEPEERARHLALAADRADARVAAAVERAAARARTRGAPDAAAELLERALALTPPSNLRARRRRALAAAEDYFYAGDRGRARGLLEDLIGELPASRLRADALRLLGELRLYDDSWPAAVPLFEEALALAGPDAGRRARIELDLCYACFNVGDAASADRLTTAMVEHAESALHDGLLAQMLAMKTVLDLLFARGLDEARLERALALEDWEERTLLPLRPSWMVGQALVYTGQVERAHSVYAELRANLLARGLESDLPASSWMTVWVECLRGDLDEAERLADEAVAGSLELESRTARVVALAARTLAGAYRGRVDSARRDGEEALAILEEIGWAFGLGVILWPLGFLALSTGDAAEAHRLLGPLADPVASMGVGEPMAAPFLPDEIEALVALGDLEQAERLLEPFERQGRSLDRAWALATSARCRGLRLAAGGELEAAESALADALAHHRRLQMPFELARTLLVRGQVQRRLRQKRAAKESLERAKATFDELGTPLWSAKASSEISRLGLRRPATGVMRMGLTETEERVAALAASGLTNREIAAQLFVSPKTVQANLGRVYEKLGIHSRAELGAQAAQLGLLQT